MKLKKLIVFLLVVSLSCSLLLPSARAAETLTQEEVYQRIMALYDTYPPGTPWTNENTYWSDALNTGGAGCAGFAVLVSDAAFGYLPANVLFDFTYADVHVGDIVRIYNNYHSVVVLEKHPNYVLVVEGNWAQSVQWGRRVSRADIEAGDYLATRYPYGTFDGVTETIKAFDDVEMSAYYAAAVEWAVDREITNGIGGGKFGPDNTVIRRDAVTFLWRAMGRPEPEAASSGFSDVEPGSYYEKAVIWAVEKGITNGVGGGRFDPCGTLFQDQMLTFLYRAFGEPGKTGAEPWYADAEKWAKDRRLMEGTGKEYNHSDLCPRADVVYYLYMAMGGGWTYLR